MDSDLVIREEQRTNVNRMLGLIPMLLLIVLIILRISWVLLKNTVVMPEELIELICVVLTPIVIYLMYLLTFMVFYWIRIIKARQKTRSTQQRRVYVGSRTRQLSVQEPTIYVSPANLPPPPKYEAMAPPSYEEVMGIHYPAQPITQPITHALNQSTSNINSAVSNSSVANEANNAVNSVENNNANNETTPPTTLTITNENRRSSVTVSS